MRLATFRADSGEPRAGLVRDRKIIDLATWFQAGKGLQGTVPGVQQLIEMGPEGLALCREAINRPDSELEAAGALLPLEPERLLAPIPRPRKNIFCLGRNYPEHRAESMRAFNEQVQPAPDYPMFFTKATTSVAAPYAELPFDFSISEQLDWEAELGLVIGKMGKNIRRMEALEHIFGYLVINDISARDIQRRHGNQYFKGKSLDNACPMGPWIVTADDIPDPSILHVQCRVNDIEKQSGYTGDMYFDLGAVLEYLSEGMTLEPGDIVATGTPEGVGMARKPPEFLQPGDVVECSVDLIGSIRNRIKGE